ncbi:MAG: hypothetical protein GWP47_09440 [Actinobacteria bacterium]|nr:hypothetical protein [Actinomycetota bacterium]NCG36506.1 hypothetical protein [Actinomycetota bacterium]
MTVYDQLSVRKVRSVVQFVALAAVVLAAILSGSPGTAERVVGSLLLGGLTLFAFKLSLVALHRGTLKETRATPALQSEVVDIQSEVVDIQSEMAHIRQICEQHISLGEALEHQRGLSERTEPVLAEFATLRQEVLYLRESVESLRSEIDR